MIFFLRNQFSCLKYIIKHVIENFCINFFETMESALVTSLPKPGNFASYCAYFFYPTCFVSINKVVQAHITLVPRTYSVWWANEARLQEEPGRYPIGLFTTKSTILSSKVSKFIIVELTLNWQSQTGTRLTFVKQKCTNLEAFIKTAIDNY